LADTSIFIGLEAERFDASRFADYAWSVSVVTLGELRPGCSRLAIPTRPPADSTLTQVPVVTQDSYYDEMPGVEVIKL
jgi:hypothetical protein